MTAKILTSCLLLVAGAAAQKPEEKRGAIEAQLISLGRNDAAAPRSPLR
jgi:hypothetical protein